MRSLHAIGKGSLLYKLLCMLHSSTLIRSLSLDVAERNPILFVLHDNLLGGQAPNDRSTAVYSYIAQTNKQWAE